MQKEQRGAGGTDRRTLAILILVGVISGFLSGMFGIGGGSIIVPALVWTGLQQRQASATSLASMIPMSLAGVASYALGGHVDWLAALLLAVGTVIGAQIGTWLLDRLPEVMLRWLYVCFLLAVIAQQLLSTPSRESSIQLSPAVALIILLVGILIGTLSGLLGVGGGAIAVPALALLGASDLIARGTSLLAILPSSLSGTFTNLRHHLVHAGQGLLLGIVAALTTPVGTWAASGVSARVGANLFAAYLCLIVLRCIWAALQVTPAFQRYRANHSHH